MAQDVGSKTYVDGAGAPLPLPLALPEDEGGAVLDGAGAEAFESEAEPEEESEEGVVDAEAGGVEDAGAPVPVSEGVEVRVMPCRYKTKRV